jgi:hypothetical protein
MVAGSGDDLTVHEQIFRLALQLSVRRLGHFSLSLRMPLESENEKLLTVVSR